MTDRHIRKVIEEASSRLMELFSADPEAYNDELIRFCLTLDGVERRAESRRDRTVANAALNYGLYWFEHGDRQFIPAVQRRAGTEFDGHMKILETYCLARDSEISERPRPPFWFKLVGVTPHQS